ncbi:hypothetical protein P43SY_007283 [Pythium insidiosum]|uniref:C2H2-type domain-containing protein n=1 Tax=Pythium insidiosum TaxID=114742 RepID=A0AAD5LUK3_PYTIN|nr:hypothetical protein P43SY_007283 [Pythium insidiosum]
MIDDAETPPPRGDIAAATSANSDSGSGSAMEDPLACDSRNRDALVARIALESDVESAWELSYCSSDSEASRPTSQSPSLSSSAKSSPRAACGRKRRRESVVTPHQFACRRCEAVVATRQELLHHQRQAHAFTCDIDGCRMSFLDEQRAVQHVETWHTVAKDLTCADCGESFLTRHDLKIHRQRVRHDRIYRCDDATCGRAYKRLEKLKRHIERWHQPQVDESFACVECSAAFPTRHEREVHRRSTHTHDSGDAPVRRHACTVEGCGKAYTKREHLRRHVQAVHERLPVEKPFGCALCGVRFVHKHALTRHHANCHSDTVNRPYVCSVCLLAFKKKTQLQAHSYVHTGVLPFECDECGERFLKRYLLVRHARVHSGSAKASQTQVFLCDVEDCDELLLSVEEKQQHLRQAHGLGDRDDAEPESEPTPAANRQETAPVVRRRFACLVCERAFDRVNNLRAHLRTHFDTVDDRRLHVCPIAGCDKAYTRKSNLMTHYNAVHDPVKSQRFKCPYDGCAGAFGYKKVLTTHIASIHLKSERAKAEETDAASNAVVFDVERELQDEPVKRRTRGHEPMGVLERVLGVSQVGEEMAEMGAPPDGIDEPHSPL